MKTCKTCKYFGAPDAGGQADCNCEGTKWKYSHESDAECNHYQDYDETTHINQTKTTSGYINKFVFVHDDVFGRAFGSVEEIEEKLEGSIFEFIVEPISRNREGKINIFGLKVLSEEPINNIRELYEESYPAEQLNIIYCYDGISCDYQYFK